MKETESPRSTDDGDWSVVLTRRAPWVGGLKLTNQTGLGGLSLVRRGGMACCWLPGLVRFSTTSPGEARTTLIAGNISELGATLRRHAAAWCAQSELFFPFLLRACLVFFLKYKGVFS